MTIKVGDRLPEGKPLRDPSNSTRAGCPINPKDLNVAGPVKGKKIAIFGLPGRLHPDLLGEARAQLRRQLRRAEGEGRRRDLVHRGQRRASSWRAWGRDQKASGKVRMLADGSAEYTKKLGLELDLTARGMGVRVDSATRCWSTTAW